MAEMHDKARNVAQQGKGKVQEVAGSATGNRGLQAKGVANQSGAKAKKFGERIKDFFRH